MDRYQKVEKPKVEATIDENEIRITSQGRMRNCITYAMALLQQKSSNEIVFKAMGRAINKAVAIVELIKRKASKFLKPQGKYQWSLLFSQKRSWTKQISGTGFSSTEYEDGGYGWNRGYARRSGWGRISNFVGRGRRGYYGPQMDSQQDDRGGYNQEAPRDRGHGRGTRGRGRRFRYNGPANATS